MKREREREREREIDRRDKKTKGREIENFFLYNR